MNSNTYILDKSGNSYGSLFRAEKILYDARSEYQRIMVVETKDMGNALFLDDIFNVSPLMEAFYHEPMAHIPMSMVKNAENALIIGGGDFGVAQHILKHDSLKSLTLCELDPDILKVSRKFFPEWAECEKDSRIDVKVGDGFDYLEKCPDGIFDLIIIDSTDPFESVLLSDEFYKRAYKSLKSRGVVIQIIADFIFYKSVWFNIIPVVKKYFSAIAPLFVPIPFYATGSWGLMIAGKDVEELDPENVSQEFLDGIDNIQTLTPELIKGWFSLPPFLKKEFEPVLYS